MTLPAPSSSVNHPPQKNPPPPLRQSHLPRYSRFTSIGKRSSFNDAGDGTVTAPASQDGSHPSLCQLQGTHLGTDPFELDAVAILRRERETPFAVERWVSFRARWA